MTYSDDIVIWCDGRKEDEIRGEVNCEWSHGVGFMYRTVAEARMGAHEAGWVTRNSRDYCPKCSLDEEDAK
jgi:hypothetical protein